MHDVTGWKEVSLYSVIEQVQSGSRPKGGVSTNNGDVPSLGGENITPNGGLSLKNVNLVSYDFYFRMKKGHLLNGDVLVNKDGAQTGKVAYYGAPFETYACINEHLFLLRGKSELIEQKYLYFTLLSLNIQKQIKSLISGSAQPGLKSDFIYGIIVELPDSISEQAKISEILSTVDQVIEQTEALIAKQQRIKTGLMQDLLTRGIDEHGNIRSEETHEFKDSLKGRRIPVEWDEVQLGSVVKLQRGYDITEAKLHDGQYPVISSSGIIGYHAEYTSKGPNVVIGRKGTIGKVQFVESNFWAHDTSLYVTIFKDVNERYIYYLFTYLDLDKYGTKSGSPSLNRNDIHPILIGLPEIKEQTMIETVLLSMDLELDSLNSIFKKLSFIKAALMQDLLTGNKRVTPLLDNLEEVMDV